MTTSTQSQEQARPRLNDDQHRSGSAIDIATSLQAGHWITKAIEARHSTRAFKPDPIPTSILEECLEVAQHSPSNSNTQPWRVTVVSGAALTRLTTSLLTAVSDPNTPSTNGPIPAAYKHYRSELGHQLYGKQGYNVPRESTEEMNTVRNRNYKFFDAPCALIICVEDYLADIAVVSAGLYLQVLCMLLQERGVGNCIEVSVAGYPDVIRKELGIDKGMRVLCGVAIGYEDGAQQINHIKAARDEWKKAVTFVSE